MPAVVRVLPADVLAAIAEQHVRPVHLVEMDFSGALVHLSEGPAVTFGGHQYIDSSVQVSPLSWDPDGNQTGTLQLLNENNAASALILNSDGNEEIAVRVYLAYLSPTGVLSTPQLVLDGIMDSASDISDSSSTVQIVSSKSRTEFLPGRVFSATTGFNRLPVRGTVFVWNNEKLVLRGDY